MEWLQILAAVGLLVGNFFFVAVEFSVTNARGTMVDELVKKDVTGAKSFKHGVDNIDNYLSACQLGITICSIGLGITAEPVVKDWFESLLGEGELVGIAAVTFAFILAYALVSMFHVVLGELAPKSLAIARTQRTGLVLLPVMRVFYLATKPVVDALNWMGNVILRPFGIPPASEAEEEVYTEPELQSVIATSQRRGELGGKEARFAHAAFTFGDRRADEVMVPRAQVAALSLSQSLREAVAAAARSGHRRLPLCEREDDLDTVVGVVNLTDVARALAEGDDRPVSAFCRPLHRTSAVTLVDDLLERLRSDQQQMALVVSEHGTALGIITIEDIIEEIVGDIRDEFDPAEEQPIEDLDGTFRVGGSASMRAVAQAVGFDPGDHREATVGGFVTERLGHVPQEGETLEVDDVRFHVKAVDGPLVDEVVVRRRGTEGSDD